MNQKRNATLEIFLLQIPGIIALLAVYGFLMFVAKPPVMDPKSSEAHYMLRDPIEKFIPTAQFEVAYFTYLSGITVAVIAALIGLIYADKSLAEKRFLIGSGIISLVLALSFVTIGYMSRNIWVMSGKPLTPMFSRIDFYFLGPVTALLYVNGVFALIRLTWHTMTSHDQR